MTDKFKQWVIKQLITIPELNDFMIRSIHDYIKSAFDEIEKEARIIKESSLSMGDNYYATDEEALTKAFENKKKEWGI